MLFTFIYLTGSNETLHTISLKAKSQDKKKKIFFLSHESANAFYVKQLYKLICQFLHQTILRMLFCKLTTTVEIPNYLSGQTIANFSGHENQNKSIFMIKLHLQTLQAPSNFEIEIDFLWSKEIDILPFALSDFDASGLLTRNNPLRNLGQPLRSCEVPRVGKVFSCSL